jgi:hypothetical protein
MNPDPLDDLLRSYSQEPLPDPPPLPKAQIWRTIERRRRDSWWSRVFPVANWREMFREPRLAVAGLAVALVMGIVPAAAAHTFVSAPRVARESLHLDVFTTCPSCMPLRLPVEHRVR